MDKKLIKSLIGVMGRKAGEYPARFTAWRRRRAARFSMLSRRQKAGYMVLTFVFFFSLFLAMVESNFLWLFGKSPSLSSIIYPPLSVPSEIISADGQVIGRYFDENRKLVTFEDISPELIATLVSTEDIRFYKHFGIDIRGVFAAIKDTLQGTPRGASTITQQLVKNMYKTRGRYSAGALGHIPGLRLIIGKTKEWMAAVKIELFYSKDEILTMYLNTVNFSSNAYGIHTAARTYFGATPDTLDYGQSALLVGMLKAVTVYNPFLNPQRSEERRNVVLQQLADNGFITREMADSFKEAPLALNYQAEKSREDLAPYFRTHLEKFLERWGDENGYNIYSDGLKIHVTIDSRLQKYAEEAVQKHMKDIQNRFSQYWLAQNPRYYKAFLRNIEDEANANKGFQDGYGFDPRQTIRVFDYNKEGYKKVELTAMDAVRYMEHFLHCGFVAMEPDTKHVKAWVGDVSFDYWKYDKVAQSKRQPGSTFKLFVYTAAMIAGRSPCDKFVDKPVFYKYDGRVWTPKNATGTYDWYPMTLRAAFARSVNSIAAQVAQEVGISEVAKCARLMGIQSELAEVPSLSLGTSNVSLLELVNAYTTVAAEGMYNPPVILTRIEDHAGNTVHEEKPEPRRVISPEVAFLMTEFLKAGITEPGGTSRALWNWDLFRWSTDFGGKTGTTSNYSDAWYVGVTPRLAAGAWVGAERRIEQFGSSRLGQGSRAALPIFGMFMEKVLRDDNFAHYRVKFPKEPKEPVSRAYKCPSYVEPETDDEDFPDGPDMEGMMEGVYDPEAEGSEEAAEYREE